MDQRLPQELYHSLPPLTERHAAYFDLDERTVLVPVAALMLTRLRWDGAVNANALMQQAAEGRIARRGPILVRRRADGLYDVLDGNSTAANAIRSSWHEIPAHLAATADPRAA